MLFNRGESERQNWSGPFLDHIEKGGESVRSLAARPFLILLLLFKGVARIFYSSREALPACLGGRRRTGGDRWFAPSSLAGSQYKQKP